MTSEKQVDARRARDVAIIPGGRVAFRELDGEAVILNVDSGQYYGLDEVGTKVWRLLEVGCTWSEICDRLLSEYDVPQEQLESDLDELFSGLISHGLVETTLR